MRIELLGGVNDAAWRVEVDGKEVYRAKARKDAFPVYEATRTAWDAALGYCVKECEALAEKAEDAIAEGYEEEDVDDEEALEAQDRCAATMARACAQACRNLTEATPQVRL